jgi:hypothetical protein
MREIVQHGGSGAGPDRSAPMPSREGPVVTAPRSPAHVFALQRAAGNGAVRQLLAPAALVVQRCGDHVEAGCPCAEGAEGKDTVPSGNAPVVSRDGPDDPPDCRPPGTRRAGSDADSVDGALKDKCLPEAYAILNSKAMFDLLPLLNALSTRATFATLKGSAEGMGGPRMVTAIAAAAQKGKEVNEAGIHILDGLGMNELPADQRRDILRYLDAFVRVGEFRVTSAFCRGDAGEGCIQKLQFMIRYKEVAIAEYEMCKGDKKLTAAMIEPRVLARMAKRGYPSERKASVGAGGDVARDVPADTSQCGPILEWGILRVHEAHHQATRRKLEVELGRDSKAFLKQWEDRDRVVQDEVEANGAELNFYQQVEKALGILEG